MGTKNQVRSGAWRSRWAAVGAAVAVTLGAGGMIAVDAASSDPSSTITITPVRIQDGRTGVGLADPLVSGVPQSLQVTGSVATQPPGDADPVEAEVVPDGATAVVLNATVVKPATQGFLSIRPGDATGTPATSNINWAAGGANIANSVIVQLPTAGDINIFVNGTVGAVLIDVAGYMVPATSGPAGPAGPAGPSGADGPAGPAGTDGADGNDGSSCTVVDNFDGTATMTCTDGSNANFPTAEGADCDPLVIKPGGDYANCDLRFADLSDADLTGANLTNTDQRFANLSGANLTNANLTNAYSVSADLSGANLTNANLTNTDLRSVDLSGANLTGANLTNAYSVSADLGGANLTNANLTNTDLRSVDLTLADLSFADLSGANLGGADLFGANLFLATGVPANVTGVSYTGTTCPNGDLVDSPAVCTFGP